VSIKSIGYLLYLGERWGGTQAPTITITSRPRLTVPGMYCNRFFRFYSAVNRGSSETAPAKHSLLFYSAVSELQKVQPSFMLKGLLSVRQASV
jgi:hypothetical protein